MHLVRIPKDLLYFIMIPMGFLHFVRILPMGFLHFVRVPRIFLYFVRIPMDFLHSILLKETIVVRRFHLPSESLWILETGLRYYTISGRHKQRMQSDASRSELQIGVFRGRNTPGTITLWSEFSGAIYHDNYPSTNLPLNRNVRSVAPGFK